MRGQRRSCEMKEWRISGHRAMRIRIVSERVQKGQKKSKHRKCESERMHIMQNFISSMPYHAAFGFLIPLLIDVLDANFQGTTKSTLFQRHSANMWTFLLATFIYCFAFAADMKSKLHQRSYSQLFCAVAVISGSLSSVSVVSIFLPCSHGHIIFIAWTIVPVVVVYQQGILIKHAYSLLHRKIKKSISKLSTDFCKSFEGNNSMEQQRVPV